jgi:hypothetical protein
MVDMANAIKQDRWYKTFLGQRQAHTYWLYKVIDDILVDNPQLTRFVELGCGTGALSIVLGLHAVHRGSFLITYGLNLPTLEPIRPVLAKLDIEVIGKDHWTDLPRITKHMDGLPTFFFCDARNKKVEFNFYADHVPSGSVIAVHDYSAEVKPEQIQLTVDRLSLEPLQQEDWVGGKDEIQTCFYRKP